MRLAAACLLAGALALAGCLSPSTVIAVGEAARCVATICTLYTQANGGSM